MTPWKHAESSVKKWGGTPSDYIDLHDWLDETKQFTGNWTHRALRHHSAGVQWCVEKFGHAILNSVDRAVPTKMVAEQHIMEDCGFIPAPADWLDGLQDNAKPWMLKVAMKSRELES
tara:strand:- start:1364 stop:1714 length:351 start_codon:yes stop_codon:yes gene_type:complete